MSNRNSSLPLHTRTHWRRVKEIITDIAGYEHINISSYKMDSITCYESCGDNLEGKTVTYANSTNESPWVSDNYYEVYEVPSKTNSGKYNFTGDFLFLAYNTSFDYWLFGTLTDKIDYAETKSTNKLVEKVKYRAYGEYTISAATTRNDTIITKTTSGRNILYGGHKYLNSMYDSFSERKKAFCKKTNSQVLSEIIGRKNNSTNNVIDRSEVKRFRKSQKKRK